MDEANEMTPMPAEEAINAKALLKAIRVVCYMLMAASGAYALGLAMKIDKFTMIFKEMLGDAEMPAGTSLLIDNSTSWTFVPVIITVSGFWVLSKTRSLHRSLYLAASLIILNILVAMFIDWALMQPLITIIVKFQPG